MHRTRTRLIAGAATLGAIAVLSTTPAFAITDCTVTNTCPPTSVPEPATLSLLALGVAGLAVARRRK